MPFGFDTAKIKLALKNYDVGRMQIALGDSAEEKQRELESRVANIEAFIRELSEAIK